MPDGDTRVSTWRMRRRCETWSKQLLAAAGDHRVSDEDVLVDDAGLDRRARDRRPAPQDDVAAWLRLEVGDAVDAVHPIEGREQVFAAGGRG